MEENKSISWGIKTKSHTAGNLQSLLVNRSQKLLRTTVLWEQDTVPLNIHCRMFTSNSACTAGTSSSYKPKNVIMSSAPQLYKYGRLLEPSERKGNDNTSWYRKRTHKQTRLEDRDVTAKGSTIYLDCRSELCRKDPSGPLPRSVPRVWVAPIRMPAPLPGLQDTEEESNYDPRLFSS